MILYILLIILLLFIFYIIYQNRIKIEEFTNRKYTAIIIEPREHKALEFVLTNFLENLSDDWNIIIFHGNNNVEYIKNIINKSLIKYKDRITLKNVHVDNLTLDDYNKLLVSTDFYKEIPTEIFLIFQTDSIICKQYKDLINTFLKYDYIGAPWKDKNIGNGGLSLRRKSKMLEIIKKCEYKNQPEDVYFSYACPDIIRKQPSFEDAKKFAMETVYNDVSFGVHKPWLHQSKRNISNKNNFCEGLDKLKELNK